MTGNFDVESIRVINVIETAVFRFPLAADCSAVEILKLYFDRFFNAAEG